MGWLRDLYEHSENLADLPMRRIRETPKDDGPVRLRRPKPFPPAKMEIETRWYEDGLIEQRTLNLRGEVVLELINTKEAHVRKALIALGWTPPK